MPRKKAVQLASAPPAPVVAQAPPPPPPYQPPSAAIRAIVYEIHQGLRRRLDALLLKYGATIDHLETRHLEAFDRVLDSMSPEEADILAKKAEDKVFVTLLSLTATGKIVAKTPEAYRKRADKAESLANYLYTQYVGAPSTTEKEAAQRGKLLLRSNSQFARSRNLREYAKRLEADPSLAPFEVLYGAKEAEADARDEELAAAGPLVDGPHEPKRARGRRAPQEANVVVRTPAPPKRMPRPEAKAAMRHLRKSRAAKKGRKQR